MFRDLRLNENNPSMRGNEELLDLSRYGRQENVPPDANTELRSSLRYAPVSNPKPTEKYPQRGARSIQDYLAGELVFGGGTESKVEACCDDGAVRCPEDANAQEGSRKAGVAGEPLRSCFGL